MLPAALLSLEGAGDAFVPRYLRSRDEAWVRRAIGEYTDLVGKPRSFVDDAWTERIEPTLRIAGASRVAALGVRHLLDRRFRWTVRAAASPERIRDTVFPIAAQGGARHEILERAAAVLGIAPHDVEDGLFADRSAARTLGAPDDERSPADIVQMYNLALVQGLLLRAERLRVDVAESVRSVVRYAKLRGLLATFTRTSDSWTRMDASGPLALFRNTLKYGHALAGFFPTLTAVPAYRLDAICQIRGRRMLVRVETGDPLPRTHQLPREFDSAVERALVRDVRRLGTAWTIAREATVLQAGAKLVFPDFALTRGDARVLVEVVGYYTEEYLTRKSEALRRANAPRMIVCVDDARHCGDGAFGSTAVLRFQKRIDAARLIALAEASYAVDDSSRESNCRRGSPPSLAHPIDIV